MHSLQVVPSLIMDTVASDTNIEPSPGHRRKARRAPREKRQFKPYSNLTWEERKELVARDEKQDGSAPVVCALPARDERSGKRRRRRHNYTREQPPPAPRVTTQFILEERLPPRDPEDVPELPEDVMEAVSSDSSDYFDRAFETCFTDDLNGLEREELIRLIRERDHELAALRAEMGELKAGVRIPA